MSDEESIEQIVEFGFERLTDNIGEDIQRLQETLRNTNRALDQIVYIMSKKTGINPPIRS